MTKPSTLLSLLIAVVMAAGVAACGPLYETQYSFAPPRTNEGMVCIAQSQNAAQMCRQSCGMRQDYCEEEERHEAERRYHRYVEERERKHEKVEHSESWFRSYGSCGDGECVSRCDTDFRINYSSCGGRVTAQQVCIAFCDKVPSNPQPQLAPVQAQPGQHIIFNDPAPAPPVAAAPVHEESAPAAPAKPKPAPKPAPASLCHAGARVDVLWKNEWYPAKVKAAAQPNGACPIHYLGYEDSYDETVAANRMRIAPE
jgi:hypothetical protein